MPKKSDANRDESPRRKGEHDLNDRDEQERGGDSDQPLNPRIVDGLNDLYSSIINEPIPDQIAKLLDELREKERSLMKDKIGHDEGDSSDGQ